jgi:hypothetical protein
MPIEYTRKTAKMSGIVTVEEAESLLEWIQKNPSGRLDLAACSHIHAANLQVIMAARPRIAAMPSDSQLAAWLLPFNHH